MLLQRGREARQPRSVRVRLLARLGPALLLAVMASRLPGDAAAAPHGGPQGEPAVAAVQGGGSGAAAPRRRLAAQAWPKSRTIHDLQALWQVPPGTPTGVLFVAHGCAHAATDFWPASPQCPACLGLPQEGLVRQAALARGYAVVAVSSFDRDTQCWHNTQASKSEDLQRLPGVLREVVAEEGLQVAPLYAFGASSGGGIVLRLAQLMPEIQGVVAQIVPARPALLRAEGGRAFPPVLFAHMAQRDPEWAQQIGEALEHCREEGIPAAEVHVDPQAVTASLLRTSPLISISTADAIVAALHRAGLLDQDGFLQDDPREQPEPWHAALQPVLGDAGSSAPLGLHVAQLLNVAYAQHELTGGSAGAALAWLEAGGRASIQELLQQEQQEQQER